MTCYPMIMRVVGGITHNIYINTDSTSWDPKEEKEISDHLNTLHKHYPTELNTGVHQVVILWGMNGKRMTDIWIFGEKESEGAGASVWVYNFEEIAKYESANVSAADGMVILGEEAKRYL